MFVLKTLPVMTTPSFEISPILEPQFWKNTWIDNLSWQHLSLKRLCFECHAMRHTAFWTTFVWMLAVEPFRIWFTLQWSESWILAFFFSLSTVQICQDFIQREWELQKGCGVCHIFISYWREPVLQQVPHAFKTASQVVRQRLWRSSILFLRVELSYFLIVDLLFEANATVFVCGWVIFVCVRERDKSLFEAMQTFSVMNFSEPLLSDFYSWFWMIGLRWGLLET